MSTPSILSIAAAFLHLGSTAFGGLAMLEPMRRLVVEKQQWLQPQEFLDGLALCQLLPGATVVQMAAYAGYRLRRTPGALAAAAGFVLPAFVFMLCLSYLYFHYGAVPWVKAVSRGLNAMVIALIFQALWGFGRSLGRGWPGWVVAGLTFLALALNAPYLPVFLGAGLLRLALSRVQGEMDQPPAGVTTSTHRPGTGHLVFQVVAGLAAVSLLVVGLSRWDFILSRLALIFLKIGTVSFGGGFVMIPILQWEVVSHWQWLTTKQFLDGILLSFATPGPLIILAAFVGFWVRGLAGAVVATFCVFLTPIALTIILFPFYQSLKSVRWMRPVLQGILAALVGMLALVIWQMGASALHSFSDLAILAGAAVALMVFKTELWIVAAVVAGLSLLIY
jgi:chromate transporter